MLDVLKQGQERFAKLIENVDRGQLAASTPCSEFDVRGLIDHATGSQYFLASLATGSEVGGESATAGSDLADAFRRAATVSFEAWSAPGALEKKVNFPGLGEMSAPSALGIGIMETWVHGWDLAKATGQDATIPDDIANVLLAAFQRNPIPDSWRKPEAKAFAPENIVPDDASPTDKLVAYLGRQP